MKKIFGILGLLVLICVFTAILNPNFLSAYNLQNTVRWTALFGILSIGVSFVIIGGGIDLSIGSVVGLSASVLALLVSERGVPPALAVPIVLFIAATIGLFHGLLITKIRLQPFVVTLCGLLLYRGIARLLTDDQSVGFGSRFVGLRKLATGTIALPGTDFSIPLPLVFMLVIAGAAIVLLNFTVYGRYLFAVGRNEEAARYSGINTDRVVIASYVFCSSAAGLGGMLFALDFGSVQPPSSGEFYELYAIAAAVLGGCSLRGGEGTIIGVIIGTAVMRVLYNAINILRIPTHLELAIIGTVILAGVVVDELVQRAVARRRAAQL